MRSLLIAIGEYGAASEDLAQLVANGGVLSAGNIGYACVYRLVSTPLPPPKPFYYMPDCIAVIFKFDGFAIKLGTKAELAHASGYMNDMPWCCDPKLLSAQHHKPICLPCRTC